jgi:Protein of unknown function (DUF4197)
MAMVNLGRRSVLIGAVTTTFGAVFALPAHAGLLDGGGLKSMLGKASDGALDKLSKPGAFYADTAIRILLPGATGKLASKLMAAVNGLKLTDVPAIATQNDGATQYLERSATPDLRVKVRPLITSALTKVGAFDQLAKISKAGGLMSLAGLTPDKMTDSVTDQTLKGIFNYMGREEAGLRGNVLGVGKSILGAVTQ